MNPTPSSTHLVLIPSYNSGALVLGTVREALARWAPVWVVIDGSTDGTDAQLQQLAATEPNLRVLVLAVNRGKGAAVLHGVQLARREGYTHALTMDADGQHPASHIGAFMAASQRVPEAVVLGVPQFDASAPALRRRGRRISNWWANLETLGAGVQDSLFGFRVYPIAPLIDVMQSRRWMRRFDFDPEAAVRLVWAGVPPLNLPAPVRYLTPAEGGVSHFNYLRDNMLLTGMHVRLMVEFVLRLPLLLWRRRQPLSVNPE
jgi:glycosyltransferase involved in cell wall biosynthesis